MKELIEIQTRLHAPKGNEAKGSNGRTLYKYRSCEDILESLKELLKETRCTIVISDDVVMVGSRIYIRATATLTNEKGENASSSAYAREPEQLATMNQSQVTGAASSYARKYALNGLLAIDDTKDADTVHEEQPVQAPFPSGGDLTQNDILRGYALPAIQQAMTRDDLSRIYEDYPNLQQHADFLTALTARRKALGIKNSNEK